MTTVSDNTVHITALYIVLLRVTARSNGCIKLPSRWSAHGERSHATPRICDAGTKIQLCTDTEWARYTRSLRLSSEQLGTFCWITMCPLLGSHRCMKVLRTQAAEGSNYYLRRKSRQSWPSKVLVPVQASAQGLNKVRH